MSSSKLLINENPLQVLPTLATEIGLNRALFLQQLHYWLGYSKNIRDGRRWVYKTAEEWRKENFPFWSISTIRRIIKSLEDDKLLITGEYNKLNIDRTKWYTINYDELRKLEAFTQNEQFGVAILNTSGVTHNGQVKPEIENTTREETSPHSEESTPDPLVALWEQIMGLPITPSMFDRLKEWGDMYGADEVRAALVIAHEKQNSRHDFILGILRRRAANQAKQTQVSPRMMPELEHVKMTEEQRLSLLSDIGGE